MKKCKRIALRIKVLIFFQVLCAGSFAGEGVHPFIEKGKGESTRFVSVNGEILARYKTLDGMYGQYSIEKNTFEKFEKESEYPIAAYPGSLSIAKIGNGYSVRIKNIDSRPSSGCPKEYNKYLSVRKGREVLSETMIIYRLKEYITGDLDGCPNNINPNKSYSTKSVSLGGPIVYNKQDERLVLVGGKRFREPEFSVALNISESGSISIKDYCKQHALNIVDAGVVKKLFVDDEVDYQNKILIFEKIINENRNISCR